MTDEPHPLDQHVVIVCSPFKLGAASSDITTWDYVPGDPGNDIVVIPERYFHEIAIALAPRTSSLGVSWVTREEDWIEKPSDVSKFSRAVSEAVSEESLWPTRAHREIVYAIAALAKRAVKRSAPIIVAS